MVKNMQIEQQYQTTVSNMKTLHQDLHDINVLFLTPAESLLKTIKRNKIKWSILSGAEHTAGIAFGVLAAVDLQRREHFLALFEMTCMITFAKLGFHANKEYNIHDDNVQQLQHIIDTTKNFIATADVGTIKMVADTIRKQHTQKYR